MIKVIEDLSCYMNDVCDLGFKRAIFDPKIPNFPRGPFFADDSEDSRLIGWHKGSNNKFDISYYYSADLLVSGSGLLWHKDCLIASYDLIPRYWRRVIFSNKYSNPLREFDLPVRVIDEPCISAIGWGFDVYGHVLIEMLPRLLAMSEIFRKKKILFKVLIREDMPAWACSMIKICLAINDDDIIEFNPLIERVQLKEGYYPTLPYMGEGFHPEVSRLFDGVIENSLNKKREGNYFISRSLSDLPKSGRICLNEHELSEVAEKEFDFKVIAPEKMIWSSQVSLFRNAESVVGLFGSALHTAIMADSNITIGCVGLINAVQTHIAALRQQRMGYVTKGFSVSREYSVPIDNFRRMLFSIRNAN